MPDTTLTIENLEREGGYLDGDMLPLSKERATELLEDDFTVYAIIDSGGAEMVFGLDEMSEYPPNTMFIVPREEWETSPNFRQAVANRMDHQEEREKAFLEHSADCFAIYQLRHDDSTRYLRYEPLERVRQAGDNPQRANYELAYTSTLPPEQDLSVLDMLWDKFNTNHPADYQHPSMSVSDIIAIKQGGVLSCHYCDRFGFQRLPDFIKPENYLKNAEIAAEDDYNMIDGIVNNGPKEPTVAELEAHVKAGQSISLADLAGAIHRESGKRKSVLAQLKAGTPKQERKNRRLKKAWERSDKMNDLTFEERNLVCIYNDNTRQGTIAALEEVRQYLETDEMRELVDSVCGKLRRMKDEAFANLDPIPDFDTEDSAYGE